MKNVTGRPMTPYSTVIFPSGSRPFGKVRPNSSTYAAASASVSCMSTPTN